MKFTFIKGVAKSIFTQNSNGSYEIEDYAYLTCRKNWWRSNIRHNCPQDEAEDMMIRLDRKGYAVTKEV